MLLKKVEYIDRFCIIFVSPSQLFEMRPHRSELHRHIRAVLVADQLVMAELASSATIVLIAPVNGPLNRFWISGYQQCLALA